jgi:hypothetical protein
MARLARIFASAPGSAASTKRAAAARSDWDHLLTILLFCAFGLLVSLAVLMLGVPLVWD